MTVFVDTSALIALLDEDDARHREAATTFRWLART
jgi:predicted nucleic acid-binding protein